MNPAPAPKRQKNTFFQFKQFRVEQERCALKVCTDACTLGAWAPVDNVATALDIGTGTGLLALMLAQRAPQARIDAVELEADAAAQARDNVRHSPWAERIQVHAESIQAFAARTSTRYDLIVSNPPFYQNSLRSPGTARRAALHGDTLPLATLAQLATDLLQPAGRLAVLLPPGEAVSVATLLREHGWFPVKRLYLHEREEAPCLRHLQLFCRDRRGVQEETLYVRTAAQHYTDAYRRLLRDFYLIF
ncbi:tRNA1Val (adenine37-N6)-methyltransferase [Catalinimonas alkaloidigena]|uniref:tRNA1(Val) (adenine(37)-N6)-methyltransferase n=1 Tax=Catalinimonas alkaloidigena TaxID=1075417 RepID=A0A1G9N5K2_9BACT|nr:methyltransferase [Catalinimonas alkaloidigena]SDL81673.1 tRNA1Val (adenine37-N6)-methyltransferase [Catalinimonas alkaloidigena]